MHNAYVGTHTKINGNNYRTLLFTDLNATDIIFTDIIIHAKDFSVKVMSVIIMTDKVLLKENTHFYKSNLEIYKKFEKFHITLNLI